jgi:hypothetical protein
MKIHNIDHRTFLVQGWTTMGFLFAANLILDTIRCNTGGSCAEYYQHFGKAGLTMITVFMLFYGAMPALIRTVTWPRFRYFITPSTMFITMSYVAHEIGHLVGGDGGKPFGFGHSLDILHHIVGLSTAYVAINWVQKMRRENKAAKEAAKAVPAREMAIR